MGKDGKPHRPPDVPRNGTNLHRDFDRQANGRPIPQEESSNPCSWQGTTTPSRAALKNATTQDPQGKTPKLAKDPQFGPLDLKPTLHVHAPARNQPSVAKGYAEGVVRADRSVGPDPNHKVGWAGPSVEPRP